MGVGMDEKNETEPLPRYRWPWFLLGMVLFGFVLAVIWMSVLVHRIQGERGDFWPKPAHPVYGTNAVPPATNSNSIQTNADSDGVKTNADDIRSQRMAEFAETLSGGNAEAGRKVFFENPAANCSRCHKAGGQGGDNGPALDGIGTRHPREFILESILFPNAVINTNFQTVVVALKNNSGWSGTIQSETETNLVLVTPEEGPVTVKKSDIRDRWFGPSPMPEGIWQLLSKQELRDLIEYVATLKAQ